MISLVCVRQNNMIKKYKLGKNIVLDYEKAGKEQRYS